MKTLKTPHMERCIGCHSCSLACARLVHKCFSWDTAGIRIFSSGGLSTGFEAKSCLSCNPAPCSEVCPTGAFSQRKGGGVVVKKNLCIHCGDCADACPVDAIKYDGENLLFKVDEDECTACGECVEVCPYEGIFISDGVAMKCDLCNGDPSCVKVCFPEALRYLKADRQEVRSNQEQKIAELRRLKGKPYE